MMELVVRDEGTAPLARMDEWRVAGKTGTAQKPDPVTGGYSKDKRTASFVGIVPADAPRLVVLVVIDEPVGDVYGGLVAAPAFREIAREALAALGVPPSPGAKLAAPEEPEAPAPAPSALAGAFAMAGALAEARAASPPNEGFIEEEGVAGTQASTTIPDVLGLTARGAAKAISAARLEVALLGSGRAIGQTPPAGTQVRLGTRVAVRLESGL